MEWNGPVKITGHSNSFFSVRPAKGARGKMTGAASDFAARERDARAPSWLVARFLPPERKLN